MSMENLKEVFDNNFSWKWLFLGGGALGLYMIKRRMSGKRCPSDEEIPGKTVIITGANCGIGKATALELAKRKGRIIMACRDVTSAEKAAQDIRRHTSNGSLVVKYLDLASMESVKMFCEDITKEESHIDILINNAGIYQCPFLQTKDGFEMQIGVNHLGHFYMTNLLLDHMKTSAPSRIVVVSSGLHKLGKIDFDNLNSEQKYSKNAGYYNSKLANNLFARELAKRLEGSQVGVFCLKPGMARTNLGRHMNISIILKILLWPLAWLLVKSADDACQTVVYCAVAEELEGTSDKFFANCEEQPWSKPSQDETTAERLWSVSAKLTGLS